MFALFYIDPFVPLLFFSLVVCTNCTNQLYNKIGSQFNERLLLMQPAGIFLYSTVIILTCFMLCWRIECDDDDDDDDDHNALQSHCCGNWRPAWIIFICNCQCLSFFSEAASTVGLHISGPKTELQNVGTSTQSSTDNTV